MDATKLSAIITKIGELGYRATSCVVGANTFPDAAGTLKQKECLSLTLVKDTDQTIDTSKLTTLIDGLEDAGYDVQNFSRSSLSVVANVVTGISASVMAVMLQITAAEPTTESTAK